MTREEAKQLAHESLPKAQEAELKKYLSVISDVAKTGESFASIARPIYLETIVKLKDLGYTVDPHANPKSVIITWD